MAHPQPRVTTLFDVASRAAETSDQEIPQPFLGPGEVFGWVHWTENIVVGDLRVKRPHEPLKSLLADAFVDLFFVQRHYHFSMTDEAPKSAVELAMERLRRKDAEAGIEERSLTEEQRAEIAEIKRIYSAKIAEAEILHKSKLLGTFDAEERAVIEQGLRRDVERLRDEQERKLQKIRG